MERLKSLTLRPATQLLKKIFDSPATAKITRAFLPWAVRNPRYILSFFRHLPTFLNDNKVRDEVRSNGLQVPPFLVLSITSRCNLHCAGCFAAAVGTTNQKGSNPHKHPLPQLHQKKWRKIITEARDLGIFGFIIAGGEPFMYPGLLDLCEEFRDRYFLIVTNGTALSKADFRWLKRASNVFIVVSIEGGLEVTNMRRGPKVYEKASETLQQLCKIGVLTGISATITRLNYRYWMDAKHLDRYIAQGIRLAIFLEHIPFSHGSEYTLKSTSLSSDHSLMLTQEERIIFRSQILHFRETKPIFIAHSPDDEKFFGGCISAGRGFAHVTPAGDLTPCPVSNVATHNLQTATLREGLASTLFKEIRENKHLHETNGMPCALFAHPKEVEALAKKTGAYRVKSIEH